ncbi:2Fe-2S iron-sulfur cluster-binding protein, partial [Tsukamurella tyrosinosolvens]
MTETLTGCHVTVNGRSRPFTGPAHTSALDWLRDQGLTGAKEGCAEGECGACSILVARPGDPDAPDDRTRWTAINACLTPAAALADQ